MRRVCLLSICALMFIAGCPTPPASNSNSNGSDSNANASNTNSANENANAPGGDSNENATPPPTGDAPAPVPGPTALLNEVRFAPMESDAPFVELKSGPGGSFAGLTLRNENGARFAVPPAASSNGLLLIVFDGEDRTDGNVVHAAMTQFLNPTSGLVTLLDNADASLDQVEWGPDRAAAVRRGGAGLLLDSTDGLLARLASAVTPSTVSEWTWRRTVDATPAEPNLNPGVNLLFPLSGSVEQAGNVTLDWFPVDGAVAYRVQVSGVADFASTLIDVSVAEPRLVATLTAGERYWRVQPIFADSSVGGFQTAQLSLVDDLAGFDAAAQAEATANAKSRGAAQPVRVMLPVPLFAQRKDTHLLLLETDFPTGTRQAWNSPHPETDPTDPADNTNCALGSISMINAFLAGAAGDRPHLSQDRIGYEVFTKKIFVDNRPEQDFNYGRGLIPADIEFALAFAVGAPATAIYPSAAQFDRLVRRNVYFPEFRETFWGQLVASIGINRPVLLGICTAPNGQGGHAIVATGYGIIGDRRYVYYNDPWFGRARRSRLDQLVLVEYFLVPAAVNPAADEEEIVNRTDADGDKVMDWEERNRFHTLVDKKDSDEDCIDDFDEIELSVFDSQHGWGQYWSSRLRGLPPMSDGAARNYAARGEPAPELTNDSDGGDLPDFVEDLNQNGQIERDKGESDPFDRPDDARKVTGKSKFVLDRKEPGFHSVQTREFEFDLRTENGKLTGTAKCTWNSNYVRMLSANPPDCPNPYNYTVTYDPVQTTVQVEGEFLCTENSLGPVLILREKEPVFLFAQISTIVDDCRGTSRSLPTPQIYPIFRTHILGAEEDRFFTGPNRRVQYKARVPGSSLPIEADSFNEWDIVMEPQ